MREILFKAKRIDNGEWVEGYLVKACQNTYPNGYEIIDAHGINYDELDCWQPFFISYEVDEKTICQYTGITDKNGNKIWENDIIRHEDLTNGRYIFREQPVKNSYVKWNKSCTRFERSDGGSLYHSKKVEVVGNIFDNPDLLKK